MMGDRQFDPDQLAKLASALVAMVIILLLLATFVAGSLMIGPAKVVAFFQPPPKAVEPVETTLPAPKQRLWEAPADTSIPPGKEGDAIRYGRELIAHTSEYLGPKGKVMPISNGMNCQNCHLDAGTRAFGNNYSAVASTYPKFRARSGMEESIEKRVNDCFERSLNGQPLPEEGPEMEAIVAYIRWLGTAVPKGEVPEGSGLAEVALLDYPASPEKGKPLYEEKCMVCHGREGEGLANNEQTGWTYPPLWGSNSYNNGAGLYRLSRFAGYIKSNMPLGATYDRPMLSDEEAWHIAAYVNSLPRPQKDISGDWPDLSQKPVDHPFGPYADGFDESQHKYGPFKPIEEKRDKMKQLKASR